MIIPCVLTATLPSVLPFRGTFFAAGVGKVGGGPAFEMLSDVPKITKPVIDRTGNLILDFLITDSRIRLN